MSIEELASRMSEQFQIRDKDMGLHDVNDYLDYLEDKSLDELMNPDRFPENMGQTKCTETLKGTRLLHSRFPESYRLTA